MLKEELNYYKTDSKFYREQSIKLRRKEIIRQVEKKHIFTHVEWRMSGIYMEVKEKTEGFCWLSAEQINGQAALPTAFRQFWDEVAYV